MVDLRLPGVRALDDHAAHRGEVGQPDARVARVRGGAAPSRRPSRRAGGRSTRRLHARARRSRRSRAPRARSRSRRPRRTPGAIESPSTMSAKDSAPLQAPCSSSPGGGDRDGPAGLRGGGHGRAQRRGWRWIRRARRRERSANSAAPHERLRPGDVDVRSARGPGRRAAPSTSSSAPAAGVGVGERESRRSRRAPRPRRGTGWRGSGRRAAWRARRRCTRRRRRRTARTPRGSSPARSPGRRRRRRAAGRPRTRSTKSPAGPDERHALAGPQRAREDVRARRRRRRRGRRGSGGCGRRRGSSRSGSGRATSPGRRSAAPRLADWPARKRRRLERGVCRCSRRVSGAERRHRPHRGHDLLARDVLRARRPPASRSSGR